MNVKSSRNWIILLVALAGLCVLVGVGIFLFSPKETPKTAVAPASTPAASPVPGAPLPDEFDPVEWTRNPQAAQGQVPAAKPGTGDQGFTVTLPSESKTPTAAPAAAPTGAGVSFPGESAPAAATEPDLPAKAVPAPKVAAVPSKAPAKAPPAAPKLAPKPTPKATVAKVPAKIAPVKPAVAGYWIQVASFKDRYQAENTAKALETQGLKGTLSTATVNGQTVVRVRVGPYTNEAEAAKFLGWLKPVKEFENSYITKVSAGTAP